MIYAKIKSKYYISILGERDSDLEINQFFDTELEAKKYFLVDFCGEKIDEKYGVEIQFTVMCKSYSQRSQIVSILTVENNVLNFEKINDYDYTSEDSDFKSRDEYVKWVFQGFTNSGI